MGSLVIWRGGWVFIVGQGQECDFLAPFWRLDGPFFSLATASIRTRHIKAKRLGDLETLWI